MVRESCDRMGVPSVVVCVTSVDPYRCTGPVWADDMKQLVKALRRRWPDAEYLGFMEWTTGKGARSGGLRRPHMHLLFRGIPPEEAALCESIVRRVWLARTGANRVEASALESLQGSLQYVAMHHMKPDQAPPEGWTGRRLRPSQGWWGADAKQLRADARTVVLERAHVARIKAERSAEVAALVGDGLPEDLARDVVYGPAEDPRPLPARQRAEVVRVRALPA